MGLLSSKKTALENEYAMMEGEMILSPKKLMSGLGIKDIELRSYRDFTPEKMKQVFDQLLHQKAYNLEALRNYVADDQKHFFATGEVNMDIRNIFNNINIADSILISNKIKENSNRKALEYNERVLWDYFYDMLSKDKHAFCVSGNLNQIDNLVLLNLKRAGRDGAILKDGSCYFPVALYERFFDKIRKGNNVIVI